MAPSSTTHPVTRQGGLALIVGVLMLVLASLIYPGGAVMNPVDQTDFPAALEAAAANASLAHLASMMSIIGMFLYGYAAFAWLTSPGRDPAACACGWVCT